LETVTGTGGLRDLGLDEMLKDNIMNWTQRIKIPVAFRSVKYKFFLAITVLIKKKKHSELKF